MEASFGEVLDDVRLHDGHALIARPARSARGRIRPVATLYSEEGKPPDVRYRFRHALLQEAAYESMLKSRRASYHHLIARHLLERSEADAGATATITYHLTRAGVTHEAVDSTAQTVGRSGPEE
jgi:predicted ATPase